jgi:hypothetical protein
MGTSSSVFGMPWMKDDGVVPPVDPADLRRVWEMKEVLNKDFEKRLPNHAPNETYGIGMDVYRRACKPGADVQAVWYRLGMLTLLETMTNDGGRIVPGLTDGKPTDAVFKVLATAPMTGMQIGAPRHGPPFDTEELIKLIGKESEA